jgi:hypothetical protein
MPTVAEVVAGLPAPVFGLDSEVLDLHFRTFSHSAEEVELIFHRVPAMNLGPGLRLASRVNTGEEDEQFYDMIVRAAAQRAALDFGLPKIRAAYQSMPYDPQDPFRLLDDFPLSGANVEVTLGDGWQGSALVWQWRMPQALRAMVLRRDPLITVASYDLSTEQLVHALSFAVPIGDRPDLIAGYQRAFNERAGARPPGSAS